MEVPPKSVSNPAVAVKKTLVAEKYFHTGADQDANAYPGNNANELRFER
jgi:hypothetical protein